MTERQYFAMQSPEEIENERLACLEMMLDPGTIQRLELLGVAPGWRCLEVGAGRGSMTRWLSERVGHSGHVVAADIDPRLLEQLQCANVEIRQHNVCEQDFEPATYDLVHCRMLLMHLPDAEDVLVRMADAVKPGGWIFIEEGDFKNTGAADFRSADAKVLEQYNRTILGFLERQGMVGATFGRRIPGLVKRLGFNHFGYTGHVLMALSSDSPLFRFYQLSGRVSEMGKNLIAEGVITQQQYEQNQRLLDKPSFEYTGPTVFGAWARRPLE